MKKIIWMMTIILSLCTASTAQAQNYTGEAGKWTFIARLQNPTDTLLIIPLENIRDMHPIVATGGEFRFTTSLDHVASYYVLTPSLLRRQRDGARNDTTSVAFITTAVPGEMMVVDGFYNSRQPSEGLTISGTPFYRQYNQAWAARSQMLMDDNVQIGLDYIKAHPGNEAATILITAIGYDYPDRMDEAVALFNPAVREGRMKDYIAQSIAEVNEYHNQGGVLTEGSPAPDFTLNDLSGKPLALSSLRGKYVVLDFWGSWCGWCIKGFPQMKEYYAKYPGRFEILGIDCNDTDAKWRAAVRTHELPWLHVYCPRGSSILNDYKISGFPTKIIISPEGKIVKTIVGEDPAFYFILDELFSDTPAVPAG